MREMDIETRKINAILKILKDLDSRSKLRVVEYLRSRVESELNAKENRIPRYLDMPGLEARELVEGNRNEEEESRRLEDPLVP